MNMYRKANQEAAGKTAGEVPEVYNWKLGVLCSVGVGFLASILGIGGGIVHVPFMVYVLNFPVHVAIATSTCILAVSSLAGLVSLCWGILCGPAAWRLVRVPLSVLRAV